MATTTTISGLPVPQGSDANNVPSDMAALAAALDGTIIRKLSTSAIAALTAPEKPAGTFFWNTTTGRLMVSNGSTVVNATPAIQRGNTGVAAGGYVDITFSPAFESAPTVVATADADTSTNEPFVTNVTTSGARINGLGLGWGANWIAVGP